MIKAPHCLWHVPQTNWSVRAHPEVDPSCCSAQVHSSSWCVSTLTRALKL